LLAKQPMLQEDFTTKIIDCLEDNIKPQGAIVYVSGRHLCQVMRGAEQRDCWTKTSHLSGCFLNNADVKKEFFDMIGK